MNKPHRNWQYSLQGTHWTTHLCDSWNWIILNLTGQSQWKGLKNIWMASVISDVRVNTVFSASKISGNDWNCKDTFNNNANETVRRLTLTLSPQAIGNIGRPNCVGRASHLCSFISYLSRKTLRKCGLNSVKLKFFWICSFSIPSNPRKKILRTEDLKQSKKKTFFDSFLKIFESNSKFSK